MSKVPKLPAGTTVREFAAACCLPVCLDVAIAHMPALWQSRCPNREPTDDESLELARIAANEAATNAVLAADALVRKLKESA